MVKFQGWGARGGVKKLLLRMNFNLNLNVAHVIRCKAITRPEGSNQTGLV